MAIYKYELRQLRSTVTIWSLCLAAAILLLFPVIAATTAGAGGYFAELTGAAENNSFFTALNIDPASLSSAVGGYAYILSVIAIGFATFGGRLGLCALTKEWSGGTADFLFTKPHSRLKIYLSKTLASVTAILISGAVFFAASCLALVLAVGDGFNFWVFSLLAASAPILCLVYFGIGMLIGAAFPTLKSPSITALGIAFVTYVIGSFSRVMHYDTLLYLSPYSYFEGKFIRETGSYDTKAYLLFVLAAVCIAAGYFLFKNKDVVADR